ncbi:MAG: hypothetical protein JSR46_10430 [Verrucomicrobia bacterium]|nr:hypothetical protein [Verrucomicrobiota bacterium]
MKTYIKQMDNIEKQYNKSHALALSEFEKNIQQDLPIEEKYRLILQKEDELLNRELHERYGKAHCGIVKLKIDDDTFAKHRWLKVLVNGYKCKAAEQEKRILECEDLELFKSNLGVGGEGDDRSPFGKFSKNVIHLLKEKSTEILNEQGINEEEIYLNQEKLKIISLDKRFILLSETFIDCFCFLGHIQGSSLHEIKNIWENRKLSRKESARLYSPELQLSNFVAYQNIFSKIIKGEIIPISELAPSSTLSKSAEPNTTDHTTKEKSHSKKSTDPNHKKNKFKRKSRSYSVDQTKLAAEESDAEKIDRLDALAANFFKEIPILLTPLRNFLCLLQVHLEVDFTSQEQTRAKALETDPHTPTSSVLDDSAADINRIKNYIKILKITQAVFEQIVAATPK